MHERALATVRSALALSESEIVSLEPVTGPNRNEVYRIVRPITAFLKVYRRDSQPDICTREALAIQALSNDIPVPEILSYGFLANSGSYYLITKAAPGQQLHAFLEDIDYQSSLDSLLVKIAQGLQRIDSSLPISGAFAKLPGNLIGVHAPDFCPITWVRNHDVPFSGILKNLLPAGHTSVLGSVSSNNLIVTSPQGAVNLSAFIDLEGARIGPRGFDQAIFWYDLMLHKYKTVADSWLQVNLDLSDRNIQEGMLANAAWLSTFRCHGHHLEQASDLALRPTIHRELLRLRAILGLD